MMEIFLTASSNQSPIAILRVQTLQSEFDINISLF